ncbi:MAG: hypothetical protein AAF660_08020 [Pseudomonadota bacterium]
MTTVITRSPLKAILIRIVLVSLSLTPWGLSMYLHYWLEVEAVWQVDMPYRGVLSVIMLAVGLALSFVTHTFLSKRWGAR